MSRSSSAETQAQPAAENTGLRRSMLAVLKRRLREPLVHFLLIGAVLFAVYHYMQPAVSTVPQSKEIRLTFDEIAQLTLLYQSQWRRDPTP